MLIYWIFLALSVVVALWFNKQHQLVDVYGRTQMRAYWVQAILFFAVIIFFCGLRSSVADTGVYVGLFKSAATSMSRIEWGKVTIDKGFYLLMVLYKQFISDDFHGWFFLWAFISGVSVMVGFRRYSYDFGLSIFFFIATTTFTYMVNGMRQFVCISIVFAFSQWIIDKKYVRFIILVLLLSTIHLSVIVMIPVIFFANVRPWSGSMVLLIIAAIIVGFAFDQVLPLLGVVLEDTQYEGYVSYLSESGVGSSIFRLLIAAVPVIMAFIGRKHVEYYGDSVVKMSVNLSTVNFLLYFIATLTSGLVLGRVAAYFDIYNLILLPWLINNIFEEKSKRLVKGAAIIFYIAYFYYQMVITWNLPYVSDILHITLWN